ncbi:hypothetical protein [Micromonospora lupini]
MTGYADLGDKVIETRDVDVMREGRRAVVAAPENPTPHFRTR